MKVNEVRGKLVVIGGAEDKEGDCTILKEFVRLAHGAKSRMVVMTVATDEPEASAAEYKEVFKRLGVDDVQAIDVSQRKDVHSEAAIKLLEQATGVFFTGGDQLHIPSLLGGTRMHDLLHQRYAEGLVLAGTSAGAAMMSNSMIIGGDSNSNPRFGCLTIGPGMDFVPGTIIDTHFSQRGRYGRLLTAVAHYPQDIGFGIDENTALVVENNELKVIGENSVIVIDAGAITYTSLPEVRDQESLTLHDVKIHVLSEGHGFDLEKRAPIDERDKSKKEKAAKSQKP